jgi:hypothetical protein
VDFWLVYDFSDDPIQFDETKRTIERKAAMELVRNTSLAYQLMRPVGTDDTGGIVILCERAGDKLIPGPVETHPPLDTTSWGKLTGLAGIDPTEFSSVVEGVHDVMRSKRVRLRTALYLLETGLQSANRHVALLLWVAALDAVLMAGGAKKFAKRLSTLLGSDSFVFPAVEPSGQPKYRVGEVAEDLYELRNTIAHGNEISRKFNKRIGFQDCTKILLEGYDSGYQYGFVLVESALFLLCAALRKVFVEKLIQTVAEPRAWRKYLEGTGLPHSGDGQNSIP